MNHTHIQQLSTSQGEKQDQAALTTPSGKQNGISHVTAKSTFRSNVARVAAGVIGGVCLAGGLYTSGEQKILSSALLFEGIALLFVAGNGVPLPSEKGEELSSKEIAQYTLISTAATTLAAGLNYLVNNSSASNCTC